VKEGAPRYLTSDRTQTTVIEDKPDYKKMTKGQLVKFAEEIRNAYMEQTTVLRCDKTVWNKDHPTMKPLKLLGRLIANSSQQGEIVLDPFGGSGSTLIACQQSNRTCYMMELDTRYSDVIIKRYEELTGDKAIKCQADESQCQ
jgi:DNA modification methylase